MPEGDTIYRSARRLERALVGRVVTAASASGRRPVPAVERLSGQEVTAVDARGKHLLVWFGPSGWALHTHLRMSGSWHLYRPGERWGRPAPRAVVTVSVEEWTAVCFDAPVCELLTAAQADRHPVLAQLGPDPFSDRFDLAEARCRLDAREAWTVADALLDQRVVAGVGNVFKSELLFLQGLHPHTRVGAVAPGARDRLLETAAALLRANGHGAAARTTTRTGGAPPGQRLHVYGRAGRPCLRCGTPVRMLRQGVQARRTFWCPGCQPADR